jgi:ubiquinone biosynthesis protein UbiJ
MEFLYGFLGALACLLMISGGVMIGWSLKTRDYARNQRVTAEALTEKQKQALKEEHEAWLCMQNYSVEDAYDLHPNDKFKESDG